MRQIEPICLMDKNRLFLLIKKIVGLINKLIINLICLNIFIFVSIVLQHFYNAAQLNTPANTEIKNVLCVMFFYQLHKKLNFCALCSSLKFRINLLLPAYIAPAPFSKIFRQKFALEKNTELCTLPHGLSSPTYTRITREMVTIEMLEPSVVIIQIRNKSVARAYLDAFNLLWKQLRKK